MQDYIKKYFWALPVLVVIVCSALAAQAVNHWVEGAYLNDSKTSPKVAPPVAPRIHSRARGTSKNGDPMVARNMFCSECLPPEPEEPTASDSDQVPLTSLPLVLVATNLASRDQYSFATVRNETSLKQGAYWIGDEIPEAGPVEKIGGKSVIFRNKTSNRSERIALLENRAPVARTPTRSTPRSRPRNPRQELMAEIENGVKKINDTTYEIDRAVVDKVLANPMAVARGARVVPSIKDGKNNGFKLYAIRPSSVYAKIGLRNGDTIHAVNGFDLTTADKALEVYQKVKESSNLSVSVTRRGKPVQLKYSIR